jgi:hydroxymethylpyrimidine/phosphomethylpyrimidine kinase
MRPRVLLLGGLDPSGGAGLTVDATVVALHGGMPLPVAVVLTAQSGQGFVAAEAVPAATWQRALAAVGSDGPFAAIKLGLLADPALAPLLAAALHEPLRAGAPLVLDPVLSATAGGFASPAALVATLVTPNLPELQALADGDPTRLLAAGARAVLVKGGHGDGDHAVDVLWQAGSQQRFVRPRWPVGRVRGTGCTLGSAIAARLARGEDLKTAVAGAGDWLAAILATMPPVTAAAPVRPLPLAAVRP